MDRYPVIWREGDLSVVDLFFSGFEKEIRAGQSILDFGCQSASVVREFLDRGLRITLVDISLYCLDKEIREYVRLFPSQVNFISACLWDLPEHMKATQWIYCCDFLHKLPPERIEESLTQMEKRMEIGGYLSIRLSKKLPKFFWEKRLQSHFTICAEDESVDSNLFNVRVLKKIKKPD